MTGRAPGHTSRIRLPRELVLASAGAGKTFRISSRIIGLLAHGERPDAILAATFTRKAAGEILGRVLERIARAALDPDAARELAAYAALPTTGAAAARPALDRERCAALLRELTRALHHLHIGTLDAFFVGAARAFAHDLGLPPAWRIPDEPTRRRVRAEALQRMLRRADPGVLIELVRMANRGEVARSVHDGVFRDLDDLHRIHHELDPSADPWEIFPDAAEPVPHPAGATRIAEAIEAVEPPKTKAGTPDKNWQKALREAAAAVRAGDWEDLVRRGVARKVLEGESTYYGKPIPADVERVFRDALDLARAELAGPLQRQARALGRLVALFDDAFTRQQRRVGAYRFEDLTRLLAGPDPVGARLDLYYRLDMRTRHLLLDEFQDTSTAQWAALRPLADEVLSGDEGARAAVVVADPKQSIYGWRGAKPALVHHVGDWYALERDTLARSWRSSQVVLDVVNRVFGEIERCPVLDEADRDVAADWARSFAPHEAARDLPGYVRVAVGPADEGRSEHRPRLLAYTAGVVAELREEAPTLTIGVLTRTNKAVARLIHELRRRGVHASEEGGNPLTDADPVTAVLALLRLADHPGDRIARYHVARSPVGAARGYTDPDDAAAAARTAERVRRRLLRDGYGRTLDRLARDLANACDARGSRRLMQLVELGFRYDQESTLRPADFVRRAETERVEDPSSAGVRVMTVHRSKGLEFDTVVLPELDASIHTGGGAGALPVRTGAAGPIRRVFPYVNRGIRPLFPEIEAAYRESRAAVTRDALSALYVAMTRARHALHVVIKPDDTGGSATTAAAIVRAALAPDREARTGDGAVFTHGDARWFERRTADFEPPGARPTAGAPEERTEAVQPRLREAPARRARVLQRWTPSELEERGSLRDWLRLDGAASRERGEIVHTWCREIGWIDDGTPDDDLLRTLARRSAPLRPTDDVADLIIRFREWIARPAVRRALSRAAYPDGASVEREVPFACRTADGILEGRIDRLVVWEEGGRTAGAEVLDYKTDRVDADDPDAIARRVDRYRPQLDAYRTAAAAMYGLESGAVAARLVFMRAGAVMEV